jgi:hypothetical protein
MNRIKRPFSVTLLAGIYIGVGTIGFAYHFKELLASPFHGIWVELSELSAILCGAFMLRGHNWARWLALAWMTFHVILSALHTFSQFAIHALFCALIAWLLLSPGSARYFRTAPIEPA